MLFPDEIRSSGVRADPTEIAGLRVVTRRWLAKLPLSEDQRQDILLASYEALANAVEHAYAPDDAHGTLDYEATYLPDEGEVVVRVVDHGSWHDAVDSDARRSRGHGLTLIRNLASDVQVSAGPKGTVVEMRWVLEETDRAENDRVGDDRAGDDRAGDELSSHDAS
ncbi:ATP-binding protein [Rhodococcus pyridinivorans]|uniref:ATP-binding protein n=1 Tax=Rhodococcus pyridinivorans TaxID=103816 RepID=UPI0009030A19|nr:ATP-binding protein [Rhodococcus sp. 2G]